MKNDLIKLALVGLTAGFCLSAQKAPQKHEKEVAMQTSKGDKNYNDGGSCRGNSCRGNSCKGNSCSGGCGSQGDQSDASSSVKNKRKSAARKVVEGK